MNEIIEILSTNKTYIITIITAVITSYFTSKITFNSEIKKNVYKERKDTYDVLEKIVADMGRNPYIIFNDNAFYDNYRNAKSQTNKYGSKEVIKILRPLFEQVSSIHDNYQDIFCSEKASEERFNRSTYNGETEIDFQREEDNYMENKIKLLDVENVYNELVKQIRKELRTK